MIVFDASYAIPFLANDHPRHADAMALVDAIAGDSVGIGTITVAEVLVHPARVGRTADARRAIAGLDIAEIPLGPDAAVRLAELRARTGLKLPDCAVVLAAQDARASRVATFDDRLRDALPALGLQPVS